MFKTKLQELCQKRSWPLPIYENTRDGPDHSPRFTSTLTVNALTFHTPSPARTAKQAQNDAAMIAFNHFSSSSPSPLPPPSPSPSLLPLTPSFPPHGLSIPSFPSFPQPSLCVSSSGLPDPSSVVDDIHPKNDSLPNPSPVVAEILPKNGVLQPELEQGCQTSQISIPEMLVRDVIAAEDQKKTLHLYKNQLQSYVQKKNLALPVYSSEWEGPPHAMRFKCKVTVNGQTYESDKFFSTLKDAEHAAAGVALMSLSPSVVQESHAGLYKNLLQELAQKEGFGLPVYNTNKSGEPHMPTFVSRVEVEGKFYTGQEAKSKKQAEMSAAKVAYMALKEQKGKSDQRSLFTLSAHQGQTREFSPDCSEPNIITDPQHNANPKSPVSPGLVNWNQPNKDKVPGEGGQTPGQGPEFSSDHSQLNVVTDLQHSGKPNSLVDPGLVTWNQHSKDKWKNVSSPSGNTNGSTQDSSESSKVVWDSTGMSSSAVDTSSSRKKRMAVYSRNTNVEIDEGGTVLPISDDKWIAISYSH